MSSTINGISQNSDMQAMILSMFNKINNATINAGQNSFASEEKGVSNADFVKALETQLQKSVDTQILEQNTNKNSKLGMPAGMTIDDENNIVNESYKELLNSIVENLDKNSDGKITEQEMKDFSGKISQKGDAETTGTLASSKAGEFLKNQASAFIQKLIDNYKDNSSSVLGIFV